MFPNLWEATHQYWHQLDELEAAYQRGEVSLEEVDNRVAELMSELGDQRRAAIQFLLQNVRRVWTEQTELVLGVGLLGAVTYAWLIIQ